MLLDDPLGSAELGQGLRPQAVGASRPLDLPEPLEHELEIGRLHPPLGPRLVHEPTPRQMLLDPAGGDLVQHGLDEVVVRENLRAAELGVCPERALDRGPGRRARQVVEPEDVPEQARETPLQRVEVSERVVTHAQKHVHRQPRPREHVLERVCQRAAIAAVIEDVLLHLVEDQIELRARGDRALREGVRERDVSRGSCSDCDREQRVVAPAVDDRDFRSCLAAAATCGGNGRP